MKLLCTADWQVSPGNIHRCELMLKHLLEIAGNEKVDAVIHLGDVKDAFDPVSQHVQNFMVRATRKITKIAPFHVLLGNPTALPQATSQLVVCRCFGQRER